MSNLSNLQAFNGQISKVRKEVLTHTSGHIGGVHTNVGLFDGKARVSGGGGSIETTHEHYTDFVIGKVAFRCYGDFVFKDDDNVSLYAKPTNQGFYEAKLLKNATKNFLANHIKLKNPIKEFIKIFLGGAFGSWLVIVLVALIIDYLFIDITKPSLAYSICKNIIIVVALFLGFLLGKDEYKKAKENREIFDKIYKELSEYKAK